MRILTVRQPWAWAIIHGGKDVENRVRNIAGDYRGPVAIHAAKGVGSAEEFIANTISVGKIGPGVPFGLTYGAILGVVDLTDAHLCVGECSPWALPTMQDERRDWWHLRMQNPRALAEPISYRGALGLRHLDDDTAARIQAGLS